MRAQRELACQAIDLAFAERTAPSRIEPFPRVSDAWVRRFAPGVVLVAHGSYRQVVELLRDLFGASLRVGTIHAWVAQAAQRAGAINRAQDLSGVRVGLHDEIFQGDQPVLAGIGAASTYCYLLQGVEQRDADTWDVHLLDAAPQGLDLDYTVADAGAKLGAGQIAAWGDKPCHGDVFHVRQQSEAVSNVLARLVKGNTFATIAQQRQTPLYWVWQACRLHRKKPTSTAFWQRWNELRTRLGARFVALVADVRAALDDTPRSSSMVENLNSRLRRYFFL